MKKILLKSSLVLAILLCSVAARAFTAVVSGNWSDPLTWGGTAPAAAVINQDIIIPAGITVTLDMDVTFTGLINNFQVDGVVSGSANGITIDQGGFTGTGTADPAWIMFNTLGTMSFTGTMNTQKFTNAGATLVIAAIINISDTLNLDAGSMVLNTGANLTPASNSLIRLNTGTLTVSGGVFNSANSYSVMYAGASRTSGVELNTTMLKNLYLEMTDNTQAITLAANTTVNGDLHLSMGILDFNGKTLTLKGDVLITAGAMFTSNSSSLLMIQGTASLTDPLAFSSGSTLNTLTVDLSGAGSSAALSGALSISNMLSFVNGTLALQSGSTLTLSGGATLRIENGIFNSTAGTFTTTTYNLQYMGGSMTTGAEAAGTGITNLTIALTSPTAVITLGGDLAVTATANLTTGRLDLNNHNFTVGGALNQNATAYMYGTSTSTLTLNLSSSLGDTIFFEPGSSVLGNLILNLASGGTMTLGSHLQIANAVTLTHGKLDCGSKDLIILSAATINSYSNLNYIVTGGVGKLRMNVVAAAPYVTFPLGTASGYSPCSIQQTGLGTSGEFAVGVVPDVYSAGYTGGSLISSNSMVARTWFIDAAAGTTVNMNLKLGWGSGAEVNGFNRNSAYISHYTSSMWDAIANAPATAGPFSTYELTRSNISSLNSSAFAVMDTTPVAIGISEIAPANALNVYPVPANERITVDAGAAHGDYVMEVFDVTGKVVLRQEGSSRISELSLAGLDKGYYFLKVTDKGSSAVTVKRIIKS